MRASRYSEHPSSRGYQPGTSYNVGGCSSDSFTWYWLYQEPLMSLSYISICISMTLSLLWLLFPRFLLSSTPRSEHLKFSWSWIFFFFALAWRRFIKKPSFRWHNWQFTKDRNKNMKNVNLTGNQIFDNIKNVPALCVHKFLKHWDLCKIKCFILLTSTQSTSSCKTDETNQKKIEVNIF